MTSDDEVFFLTINEGAKILYSAGLTGTVTCWNLVANNQLKKIETQNDKITAMFFSESSNQLFIANIKGFVFVYNTFKNQQTILEIFNTAITSMAL